MNSAYLNLVKPIFDTIISIIISIILILPLIIIAILIRLESKGSCLFVQKRIGRNGKRFNVIKFRTMRSDTPTDTPTHLLQDPKIYITKTGAFLRKYSLDELPQLFNIIVGQMSIVGPRPALYNQYDLEKARQKNGSDKLKPGITGLAQIRGRDELSIEVKAAYDGEYAENAGMFYDIKIIFKTISVVLSARGIKEGADDDK